MAQEFQWKSPSDLAAAISHCNSVYPKPASTASPDTFDTWQNNLHSCMASQNAGFSDACKLTNLQQVGKAVQFTGGGALIGGAAGAALVVTASELAALATPGGAFVLAAFAGIGAAFGAWANPYKRCP